MECHFSLNTLCSNWQGIDWLKWGDKTQKLNGEDVVWEDKPEVRNEMFLTAS